MLDNGQVWFGIFSEPNIKSDGILLDAPPGDVTHQAFALKKISASSLETDIQISKIYTSVDGTYTIGYNLDNGSVTPLVEDATLTSMPFVYPDRWLFIGYRAKLELSNGSATIKVLFSNLQILSFD